MFVYKYVDTYIYIYIYGLTCKRGSVGQSDGLLIRRSSFDSD